MAYIAADDNAVRASRDHAAVADAAGKGRDRNGYIAADNDAVARRRRDCAAVADAAGHEGVIGDEDAVTGRRPSDVPGIDDGAADLSVVDGDAGPGRLAGTGRGDRAGAGVGDVAGNGDAVDVDAIDGGGIADRALIGAWTDGALCKRRRRAAANQQRRDRTRRQKRAKATPTDTHLPALLPGSPPHRACQSANPTANLSAGGPAATRFALVVPKLAPVQAQFSRLWLGRHKWNPAGGRFSGVA